MARMHVVEFAAVAALAGSLAACGTSTSKPAAAPVTVTSTVQAAPPSSATTTPGGTPSTTAANASTPSAPPSTQPVTKSSSTASGGGTTSDRLTIVGTLQYLAPGKFIVHPDDGGTDQAFYVSNATQILGAAAICGDPNGNVTIGADDYGTTKCTADQLETASKSNSVKVRVIMDRKTFDVLSVAERYHP